MMAERTAMPIEVVDGLRELAERLERGDDGDVDSPTWENERQMVALRAQVRRYLYVARDAGGSSEAGSGR